MVVQNNKYKILTVQELNTSLFWVLIHFHFLQFVHCGDPDEAATTHRVVILGHMAHVADLPMYPWVPHNRTKGKLVTKTGRYWKKAVRSFLAPLLVWGKSKCWGPSTWLLIKWLGLLQPQHSHLPFAVLALSGWSGFMGSGFLWPEWSRKVTYKNN